MRNTNLTQNSNKELEKEVLKVINREIKTKENLLDLCEECIEENKGLRVYIEIPGNKALEVIENVAEDIANKKKYYEVTYDDNLKHKTAPVKIHSAEALEPLKIPNVVEDIEDFINSSISGERKGYLLELIKKNLGVPELDNECSHIIDTVTDDIYCICFEDIVISTINQILAAISTFKEAGK